MALEGIRVIEAASLLAAPLMGMLLADHGADVIKVEVPDGGDQMRNWGYQKEGLGLFWKMIGRNKRLVTLDLRTAEGGAALLQLVKDADVLIENFRPGTLARWGLSDEVLRASKPDLIIARITGFGQTGPSSSKPGFGTLAESMAGFASINGWPDKPPSLAPFGLADAISGIVGAFGVLAALRYRDLTGEGQDVDLALYEGLMTVLGSIVIDYDQLGIVPGRTGNGVPFSAPRGVYQASDGRWFALAASSQATTDRTFKAIGHPEYMEDPRFKTNQLRVANTGLLDIAIAEWAQTRTLHEILATFDEFSVPATAVQDAAAVANDPHIRQRGSLVEVEDPDFGTMLMQAPIPRLTKSPGKIRFTGRGLGHDNHIIDERGVVASPEEAPVRDPVS
jgi:crotonobetainyl-CoA:carnitine CoA-transferase CaiB-like acyl-CoA transferase